ncbi:MAG: hypothetical protein R3E10_11435 [Gemmatimonadota bacterium]
MSSMRFPFRPLLLALVLSWVTAAAAGAQVSGSANPCMDPQIAARIRTVQQQIRTPLLYDGLGPLKATPALRIQLPLEAMVGACVLLSAALVESGGRYSVQDAGPAAMVIPAAPGNLRRDGVMLSRAATQVLREVLAQDVLPQSPRGSGRYLVAIPLWSQHPLYQAPVVQASTDGAWPPTLRDRGWPASQLLGTFDGSAVYLLAEREWRVWLAVVRPVTETQPLLDFQESGETDMYGRPVLRYGTETSRRFREQIVPLLRPTGNAVAQIEIWHYGTDVRLLRQPDTNFQWAYERHPLTSDETVEVPMTLERWFGRRSDPTQPFVWMSGDDRNRVEPPLQNNVLAIREIQEAYAKQQALYAAARAERDSRERAERQAKLARRAALEQERARTWPARGLAYVDPTFWDRFQASGEFRAIFEGFFPNATEEWEFGQIYKRTVLRYSDRCADLIPLGSKVTRTVTTVAWDDYTAPHVVDQDTAYIHTDFVRPFELWDADSPAAPALYAPGFDSRNPGRVVEKVLQAVVNPVAMGEMIRTSLLMARMVLEIRQDLDVLFEQGCESPVLEQFQENMRRLAYSLPTLQQERVPATLPDLIAMPLTFGAGCQRYIEEGGFRVGREWCPCLERVFNVRTTVGERWTLLDDYTQFFRLVDTAPTGPNDPGWAFYEPANVCRQ